MKKIIILISILLLLLAGAIIIKKKKQEIETLPEPVVKTVAIKTVLPMCWFSVNWNFSPSELEKKGLKTEVRLCQRDARS